MDSLGVIGGGVLGRAVARGFMEHREVRVFDQIAERATHSLEEAATADIVMICLPTPAKADGRCDTSAIDTFLHQAYTEEWWTRDRCYVIRSTVPVGYTQGRAAEYLYGRPLFHSPEFLTARCSIVDFQTPSRNIIGCPEVVAPDIDWLKDNWVKAATAKLHELYFNRFPGVPLLWMASNASELVKLGCNSFFALKVTFFNLLADAAAVAGVPWGDVREGVLSDGRIAHAHTQVPGPDGKPGFGGTCLPKDTANLAQWCKDAGMDADFLADALARNAMARGEHFGITQNP